jgi:hypothetical protein
MMQSTRSSVKTTDGDPAPTCPHCASSETIFARCTEGLHYGKIRCPGCGWTTFAKTPWTLERARAFKLYFGRYRGRKLGALASTEEGRGYLAWLAANVEGNVGIAARILVDHVENTCSDVSPAHERARRLRNAGPLGDSVVVATGHAAGVMPFSGNDTNAPQS